MNEHVCPWWLAYSFDNPLRSLLHNPKKLFTEFVQPGITVMDIGCGMGHFTLGLARIVGENGMVHAVDLQQKMLDQVMKRAKQRGLAARIRTHLADGRSLEFNVKPDLILNFWMLHEVPDQSLFIQQIYDVLKPDGYYFLVEPKIHTSQQHIEKMIELVLKIGFVEVIRPRVAISRAAVFRKP